MGKLEETIGSGSILIRLNDLERINCEREFGEKKDKCVISPKLNIDENGDIILGTLHINFPSRTNTL